MFSLKRFLAKRKARKAVEKWFGRPDDYTKLIEEKTGYEVYDFIQVEKNERGKIYRVWLEEANDAYLSFTVRNEVRGGYLNPVTHHCAVLKGRVMWTVKVCLTCPPDRGTEDRLLRDGDQINTLPGTPHFMISMGEPSVILEWLDQPKYEETPYPEFRAQVEAPL